MNIKSIDIKLILVTLIIAFSFAFIKPFLFLLFAFLLLGYLFYYNLDNFIISIVIILLITASSEFYADLRAIITAGSLLILLVLFLRKYGLIFNLYPKVPSVVAAFIVALIFIISISTLSSANFYHSFFYLTKTVLFFTICYLLFSLLDLKQNVFFYIAALIISLLFHSLRILIDLYNLGFELFLLRSHFQFSENLYSSLGYTGYTIFFITLSFAISFIYRDKYRRWLPKLILILFILFNFVIIIITNARGALLSAILSSSFIIYYYNKTFLYKVYSLLILIVFFMIISFPSVTDGVVEYLRFEQVGTREIFWNKSFDIISENLLLGVGPGQFDGQFYNYLSSIEFEAFSTPFIRSGVHHSHNIYLLYTAENGIPGLIVSVSFFVLFFYIATKTLKNTRNKNKEYNILAVAITGIGIGIFSRSFLEVSGHLIYGHISTDLPFWVTYLILIKIYQYIYFEKNRLNE